MTAVMSTTPNLAELPESGSGKVNIRLQSTCPHCGKVTTTDLVVDEFVAQLMVGRCNSNSACTECAGKIKAAKEESMRLARIEENLRTSGIGEKFLGKWDPAIGNRKLANAIRENSGKHLFVVGAYGAGKTSCTSVNLERQIKAGKRGKYYKFNHLAHDYSQSFSKGETAPKDFIAGIFRYDVVVIDDLCKKETVSKTAAEFCYELLDYIYEHDVKCRVWFTSNITPAKLHTKFESQDLASAVASRIDRLHNAGQLVLIKAEDFAK